MLSASTKLNDGSRVAASCQHVIRRCRAVIKLGPGGLQSWAGGIIAILREAHQAVQDARARVSTALDADLLVKLGQRYDQAAAFGIIHNRLRDWHDGNHPRLRAGLLAARVQGAGLPGHRRLRRGLDDQRLPARRQSVKRHQAVCGYWHCLTTLSRWCRVRSYLDSAANHGLTALDAVSTALAGQPWLPVIPNAA